MSFLSSMNIREKTLQKISERFQGVWAFTKLAMVDTKSRLFVTRLLLFIVQQSTTGSFLSFIFSSICHFIFPSLPLFVFSSLCLFVPSHVYCSPVTKRVASQTVLNEFGESPDALLWIQNKIFTNSPQSLCLDQMVPCVFINWRRNGIVITFYYHLRNYRLNVFEDFGCSINIFCTTLESYLLSVAKQLGESAHLLDC